MKRAIVIFKTRATTPGIEIAPNEYFWKVLRITIQRIISNNLNTGLFTFFDEILLNVYIMNVIAKRINSCFEYPVEVKTGFPLKHKTKNNGK